MRFWTSDKLKSLDLIVPGLDDGDDFTGEQLNPVLEAVKGGVGLAGCHGGMCDAFRNLRPSGSS